MEEIEKSLVAATASDGAEAKSEEKPRKKLGCCGGCTLALLGLVIAGGFFSLWWTSRVNRASSEFAREVEEALEEHQAGLPVIDPAEDAAPLYAAAWGLYVAPGDPENLRGPNNMYKAKPEVLARYIIDNAAYRAALKKAVARPEYGLRTDLSAGAWANIPDVQQFRNALRYLTLAARHEARQGNTAEAVLLLQIGLRIARDAGADRLLINRMIQIACEGMTVSGLEYVLNESDPSEQALRRLLEKLSEHIRGRPAMHLVFRQEKLRMMATLKGLVEGKTDPQTMAGGVSPPGGKLVYGVWRASGLALKDARNVLKCLEERAEAARKPFPGVIAEMQKVGSTVDAPSGGMAQVKTILGGKTLLGLFVGSGSWAMISEGRGLAKLRLARLALGCRIYKLKNGSYPAKLSELSKAFPKEFGKLPVDPFTGKDMKYARTKTGCKLWSIRDDGVDNGGVKLTNTNRNACDIVFELTK
jgi:hypothetical protein